MKKIEELNAKVNGNVVDVFAVAKDDEFGEVTLAYELFGGNESIFVYAGRINREDPGEGPYDEYGSRDEAIASKYGHSFSAVFAAADALA